jgi:hypothetical protein
MCDGCSARVIKGYSTNGYVVPVLKSSLQKNKQWSSRTSWTLRNIHISNRNGSFMTRLLPNFTRLIPDLLTIWLTRQMSYTRHELLTLLSEHQGSPLFFCMVLFAHLFSFLRWAFYICFSIWVLCPIFLVSLGFS